MKKHSKLFEDKFQQARIYIAPCLFYEGSSFQVYCLQSQIFLSDCIFSAMCLFSLVNLSDAAFLNLSLAINHVANLLFNNTLTLLNYIQ